MPVGTATRATPRKAITADKIFPATVTGYISPYPTVVNVAIAHQRAEKALSNSFGWAECSMLYINTAEIIIRITSTSIEDRSC